MSEEYSPGEIVNINILGARVMECDGITILVDLPHQDPIGLYLDDEQVTVLRAAPAGGPPQPGDMWLAADLTHATGGARVRHAVAALDAARVRHPDEALTALVIYQRNGGGLTDAEQVEVIGHYVNPDSDTDRQVAHDCRIRCGNARCEQCFPTLPVIDAGGDRP